MKYVPGMKPEFVIFEDDGTELERHKLWGPDANRQALIIKILYNLARVCLPARSHPVSFSCYGFAHSAEAPQHRSRLLPLTLFGPFLQFFRLLESSWRFSSMFSDLFRVFDDFDLPRLSISTPWLDFLPGAASKSTGHGISS